VEGSLQLLLGLDAGKWVVGRFPPLAVVLDAEVVLFRKAALHFLQSLGKG
jgi:hypothetical protein